MYNLIRGLLFKLDPELAHNLTLNILRVWQSMPDFNNLHSGKSAPLTVMGLKFPNRIGLAAGLDKDGLCAKAWQRLGFGFIELGTVTPYPQIGNPKPRLFRLTQDHAIINRMGFNNNGVDALVARLQNFKLNSIVGINIGKNKDTPLESSIDDYSYCLKTAYPVADYITINISSPNTKGLRDLQAASALEKLLLPLKQLQASLAEQYAKYVPLVVKLAPDLEIEQLKLTIESLLKLQIDGVISSNTTLDRNSLQSNHAGEIGGLSGAPLLNKSTEQVRNISKQAGTALPIIAVGGIMSKQDAQAKLNAGASLVQLYTGLIYKGPQLIKQVI